MVTVGSRLSLISDRAESTGESRVSRAINIKAPVFALVLIASDCPPGQGKQTTCHFDVLDEEV